MSFLSRNVFGLVFVAVWAGYFILLAMPGMDSAYENFGLAVTYEVMFVAVAAVPLFFLLSTRPTTFRTQANGSAVLAAIGICLSLLAVSSLFVDKLLSGINYSDGLCLARYQMNALGEQRAGGISSPFSVIGHLFSYSFFVSTGVVLTRPVSRTLFWTVILTAFVCLMALSIVASSRSTILLFCAFVGGFLCIRIMAGSLPRVKLIDAALAAVVLLGCAWFVVGVFDCRAKASGLTTAEYAEDFAPFLGAKINPATPPASDTPVSEGPSMPPAPVASGGLSMVILYAVHSAYTFAWIISEPEGGNILLGAPRLLLAKVGIGSGVESWGLSGRFPSLPGALYHDFNLVGMILGALALGVGVWVATRILGRWPNSVVALGVVAAAAATLIISPLHFVGEIIAFPFIMLSFLVVPGIALLIGYVNPQERGYRRRNEKLGSEA